MESETACFNGAASSAISYYRRAGDMTSAMRVFNTARAHPTAATKWQYISQTPRVYHPGTAYTINAPHELTTLSILLIDTLTLTLIALPCPNTDLP